MRKTICLIMVMLLVMTLVPVRSFAAEDITVNAIPDKHPGDSVAVSGSTAFDIVSIKILYPNGDQYNVESVQSSRGEYSYTFTLSQDLPTGFYIVVAGRGDITAVTTFTVNKKPSEDKITVDPIPVKYPGESVTVSGSTAFDIVSIKILYPSWDQYNVETVQSSEGKYSYTFRLSSDLPYGTYIVVAGKGNNVAVTEFNVVPLSSSNNAYLSSIKIDGIAINGFSQTVKDYTVMLPYGRTVVPVVSATAQDSGANVEITQAAAIAPYGTTPGDVHKAIIQVTAADGVTKNTYTVAFISSQSTPTVPDTPETQDPESGVVVITGEQLPLGIPEEDKMIEKIKEFAEEIKGSTAAEKASIVRRFLEYSKEVLNAVDTTDDPELVLHQIAALIDAASVLLQNLPDGKEAQDLKASLLETLGTLTKLIEKAKDMEEAWEILESIIVSVSQATGASSVTGREKRALEDKLVKVLQSHIEKQTGVTVEAGVQDSYAVADIDSATADEIIKKMDEIIRLADSFHAKLKGSGISAKTRKNVILDISADSDSAMLKAGIPGSIFNTAGKKGIDSIEIRSETASFEIPPGFISDIGDGSNISFGISRVELSDEEAAKLSEEQKKLLEKDSTVFDFNLIKDGKQLSAFEKKITIRLKYDLKEGEDKDNITVLYLADDGTVKNMTGRYDEAAGEVVFTTDHFSSFVVKSLKVVFSDIEETFWGKKYIESMSSKGILNGKPGGVFDPHGLVTRAEFAKMISLAAGILDEGTKCTMSDVSEDKWYYKYVASAVKAGIINGRPDNTFGPDDYITRQEMAVMVSRALGESAPGDPDKYLAFGDNGDIGAWAKEGVATVVKAGIMNGTPEGLMNPRGNSTRAEAAAVIYRYFNY